MKRSFFLSLFVIVIGCSSQESILSDLPIPSPEQPSEKKTLSPLEIGTINAVKKAYQMTNIEFTPENPIEANYRTYNKGTTYQGLIYSSVKEIGTAVGSNISFHTFMTAIHNPRSKIYTERLNEAPYHGTNCKAYYGTVCSGLVSYALGVGYGSYDIPESDLMMKIDHNEIDSIHVADILWKSGHVALITRVAKDDDCHVTDVEICEALQNGCKRYSVTSEQFISLMTTNFKALYRYTELYKNVDYTPVPEFVAVLDESPIPFVYNDDLCADKGDKACYREDEDVTINIMHEYECLEVYKDDAPYQIIDGSSSLDVVLQNLPYGDYKARIAMDGQYSDYTYWKVVNIELSPDRASGRLYFKSANGKPYKMKFTNISGSRKNAVNLYGKRIIEEDIERGYIEIPQEQTKKKFPYIHFSFSTEYGIIENNPINWFE